MKTNTLNTLLFASALALASCGGNNQTDYVHEDSKREAKQENQEKFDDTTLETDSKFAVDAADGGMLEVQLAELALTNASSEKVKKFAKDMAADHGKTNEELKALATKKNITIPVTISDKNQRAYKDLAEKTGAEFDKAYIDFMVKDHKKDIEAFEKEAEKGMDMELKAWASSKLPTLKHHLHMAEQTQDLMSSK